MKSIVFPYNHQPGHMTKVKKWLNDNIGPIVEDNNYVATGAGWKIIPNFENIGNGYYVAKTFSIEFQEDLVKDYLVTQMTLMFS